MSQCLKSHQHYVKLAATIIITVTPIIIITLQDVTQRRPEGEKKIIMHAIVLLGKHFAANAENPWAD